MKLVCWNVRGSNKPFKQKEIKHFLLKNKFEICALLETRVKVDKFKKASSVMFRDWPVIDNYDAAPNGRIWVAWNPRIWDIKVVSSCAQAILREVVSLPSCVRFHLVVVYAYNTQEQRKELWNFIDDTCNKISGNLLIGGDFNSVLLVDDRLNGNPDTHQEIQDFDGCLPLNNLSKVRTLGD